MSFTRKEYTNPAEKTRDFWLGFGLWFGLNIVMALGSWAITVALAGVMSSDSSLSPIYSTIGTLLGFVPFLVNIGLIIYFAFTRSQIALGMLAGFGAALLVVVCLGIVIAVACFVIIGGQNIGG